MFKSILVGGKTLEKTLGLGNAYRCIRGVNRTSVLQYTQVRVRFWEKLIRVNSRRGTPEGQVHAQISYGELSQLQWKLGYIPVQNLGLRLGLVIRSGAKSLFV